MRYLLLMTALFMLLVSPSVYANPPKKVLKISEIQPGTEAIGFSVFKGVEPQPFNVVLEEPVSYLGPYLILAAISGGPMETPLEKIGGVAGMSGSPIFIDCIDKRLSERAQQEFCVSNGTLVGALSYAPGSFIESGPS